MANPTPNINGPTFFQPDVVFRPETPGKITNGLKSFDCYLKSLRHLQYAKVFLKPVDLKDCSVPNYYEVIKNPMDIGTILKRIKNYYYECVQEALSDFQQMLRNCFLYNNKTDYVYECGLQLKRSFYKKLLTLPQVEKENRFQKIPKNPVPPHIEVCAAILRAIENHKSTKYMQESYYALYAARGFEFDELAEPMDVPTIRMKLKYLLHIDFKEFVYDCQLIYCNAIRTFHEGHECYKAAQKIRHFVESLVAYYLTFKKLPTNITDEDDEEEEKEEEKRSKEDAEGEKAEGEEGEAEGMEVGAEGKEGEEVEAEGVEEGEAMECEGEEVVAEDEELEAEGEEVNAEGVEGEKMECEGDEEVGGEEIEAEGEEVEAEEQEEKEDDDDEEGTVSEVQN